MLTLSEWHSVRVGRYRRKLYLWVDGMVNYAVLQPPEGISAFENLIYFGESAPFVNNSIIAGRLFVFKLLLILWTKKSPVYCLGVPSSLIFLKKFLDFSMFSTPGRVIKKKKNDQSWASQLKTIKWITGKSIKLLKKANGILTGLLESRFYIFANRNQHKKRTILSNTEYSVICISQVPE